MKLEKSLLFTSLGVLVGIGADAAAIPEIVEGSVVVTQDRSRQSREVTVEYVVQAPPCIVTADVQTNCAVSGKWVSIGVQNFRNMTGDVNVMVTNAGRHVISWLPRDSWPDHKVKDNGLRVQLRLWTPEDPPDYLVADLTEEKSVKYYESLDAFVTGSLTDDVYRQRFLVMRKIPARAVTWPMGAPTTEVGYFYWLAENDNPQHNVTFSQNYYMAIFPFTHGQYKAVMGSEIAYPVAMADGQNPMNAPASTLGWGVYRNSDWPTSGRVVGEGSVLWNLRTRTGIDFDLPTEAQWEYACRAGTWSSLNNGQNLTYNGGGGEVETIAWLNCSQMQEVGLLKPNNWGLYDMHGLVMEMCLDWYDAKLSDAIDPIGPKTGAIRVSRGGPGSYAAMYARSAARFCDTTYVNGFHGFRPVCPAGSWAPVNVPEE